MTDRPILFSAPMVRAILREVEQPGTGKTQTRRIIKDAPSSTDGRWSCDPVGPTGWRWVGLHGYPTMPCVLRFAKGDRLWVRETISFEHSWTGTKPRDVIPAAPVWYWADGDPQDGDWTEPIVSIHMPRWASRLTLTVTDVRVQRLQEISDEDVMAEGCVLWGGGERDSSGTWHRLVHSALDETVGMLAPDAYRELWEHINGAGSWDANPWVVAVTFRPERRNIDA